LAQARATLVLLTPWAGRTRAEDVGKPAEEVRRTGKLVLVGDKNPRALRAARGDEMVNRRHPHRTGQESLHGPEVPSLAEGKVSMVHGEMSTSRRKRIVLRVNITLSLTLLVTKKTMRRVERLVLGPTHPVWKDTPLELGAEAQAVLLTQSTAICCEGEPCQPLWANESMARRWRWSCSRLNQQRRLASYLKSGTVSADVLVAEYLSRFSKGFEGSISDSKPRRRKVPDFLHMCRCK